MLKGLIVSVAYNPPLSLTENLAVDYFPHLIVDNSAEESKWLKEFCDQAGHQYYWLGGNQGIAAALNYSAQLALEQGFTHLVTMDQDSRLSNELLSRLNDFVENAPDLQKIAVASPLHMINGLDDYHQGEGVKDDPLISMTSGNLLNLAIWEKLGGFTQKLFIDGVDIDYYLRACLADYRVLTLCDVRMVHDLGNACQMHEICGYRFEVTNHSALRKYYIARNFLYLYQTYKQRYSPVKIYIKILLKMIVATACFEENKINKLRFIALGIIDYFRGRWGKLK